MNIFGSGIDVALFYRQILAVCTQVNTPNLTNQSSSLGPLSNCKVRFINPKMFMQPKMGCHMVL